MRSAQRALLSAAAFGFAVFASGSASAASVPALDDALRSAQTQAYPGEAYTQHRRGGGGMRAGGGGGGMRHGGGGMRHVGGGHRGGGFRGGRGAGAAIGLGLAAGLIGAAIASQPAQAQPVYGGGGHGWNRYCFRRFGPSFDPASGTYLAANGYRYPCQ